MPKAAQQIECFLHLRIVLILLAFHSQLCHTSFITGETLHDLLRVPSDQYKESRCSRGVWCTIRKMCSGPSRRKV